ncbi:MAG: hypothetical protein ACFCVE_09095 [Phycisphaerae bacterium]
MCNQINLLAGGLVALALATTSQATVLFDFESGMGSLGVRSDATSTTSAAVVDGSLQVTRTSGGYQISLNTTNEGVWDTVAENTQLLFDVRAEWAEVDTNFLEIGPLFGGGGNGIWREITRQNVSIGSGWQTMTFDIPASVAPGGSWRDFMFHTNMGSGTNVFYIDNIRVEGAIPEPASMAVLGLGMLPLVRRRRSRA